MPYGVRAFPEANVEYANVTQRTRFADDQIDLILAISPFNYPVFNRETIRVLKRGGHVCILGNAANKFANRLSHFCTAELQAEYGDMFEPIADPSTTDIGDIIDYLRLNYTSRTTDGHRETALHRANLWRRR